MPAIVGVDARTSAARSQSGVSCSWPTAETIGTGQAGDRADEALVAEREQILEAAAAAREHDDVDVRAARTARASASMTPCAARGPWTYVSATSTFAAGKRAWIVVMTSRFAAASFPVTSPIRRGSSGSARFRSAANRPFCRELRLQPLERGEVRADAEALDRERAHAVVAALLEELGPAEDVHALAVDELEAQRRRTCRAASSRRRDEPSAGSLSVKKTLAQRSWRFSSVTSPSTQSVGSSPSHCATPRLKLATE